MKCCTVLVKNDTMFQQFWLFIAKSWPYLILQESAEIWAPDGHTQVHFSWRTSHTWISEHPDCAMKFSPWWQWKVPFSFVVSAEGQMNTSMSRQPLRCNQRTHCLNFFSAANVHEIPHIPSKTDFTHCTWHSFVIDVGVDCERHGLSLSSHSSRHSPISNSFTWRIICP